MSNPQYLIDFWDFVADLVEITHRSSYTAHPTVLQSYRVNGRVLQQNASEIGRGRAISIRDINIKRYILICSADLMPLNTFRAGDRSQTTMLSHFTDISQWAFGDKMTSYQRRCDVITSHRRLYDVIFTSYARWVGVSKFCVLDPIGHYPES